MNDIVTLLVVGAIVLGAVYPLVTDSLLRATLSLAVTSGGLAVYFYGLGAAYAAVFEAILAVGLVPVLFLFIISLTEDSRSAGQTGVKRAITATAAGSLLLAVGLVWTTVGGAELPVDGPGFDGFAASFWAPFSVDIAAAGFVVFVGVLSVVRLTEQFSADDAAAAAGTDGFDRDTTTALAADGNGEDGGVAASGTAATTTDGGDA